MPAVMAWELSSSKINARHRDRLAVVYMRQSTLGQVHDHPESTRLQYALVDRAVGLGWPADRVVVIDEDLGRSGAGTTLRPGFQRLFTEISLGHVGLVVGIDMSRLAPCGRDWYQLIELCALAGTLLADTDGVYDPGEYNDRLLLVEGHDVRSGTTPDQTADAGGAGEQGPPRRAGPDAADRLLAASVR